MSYEINNPVSISWEEIILDEIIENIQYFNPEGQTIHRLWMKIDGDLYKVIAGIANDRNVPNVTIYDIGKTKGIFLDFDVYYHAENSEDKDEIIMAWDVDGSMIYRII